MSKCWYCNNELTSEENQKHFGICNNCYNEFEGADTIFHSLTNKIVELQKQLEEKNKTIEGLLEEQKNIENSASYQMFLDIQKQLEEKEKELKEIRVENYTIKSYRDFLNNQCKNLIKENKKLNRQLKSQPAEIVEKIKERVLKIDKTEIKTLDNGYSTLYCDRPEVITIIDTILQEYKK